MGIVVTNKEYLESDDFIIVDINNLENYSIDSFSLSNGKVANAGDYSYIELYNDNDNPFVIKDDFGTKCMYINPEYYVNNQNQVDQLLCKYISECKNEELTLKSKGLIKEKIINSIVKNKNIRDVTLAKYSDDGYTLTVDNYNVFKKAGIRVDSKNVCDELKDNFDDIIKYNSEKKLISYYNYSNLSEIDNIIINEELSPKELDNLKYISPNLTITIDFDSFDYVKVISQKLEELNKNNRVIIKLSDKNKFNDYIFNNELSSDNIYVKTPTFECVSINDYLKFEKILYQMVSGSENLSNFEKYIYAYNITKQFKSYKNNEFNRDDSKNLYSILINEYMVCTGYSKLFGDLLDKMGLIENYHLSIDVDVSYDNVKSDETNFDDSISVDSGGHARRYIHIVDEKYNIDGYYVSDPTWDNNLEHDYYNHLAMTDSETTLTNRYQFWSKMDIFNVSNINEYIDKMKYLKDKEGFDSFLFNVSSVIDIINKIDIKSYEKLKEKYNFIGEATWTYPDDITDFVYELGDELLNKVNKPIPADTIFNAVESVYRNSYGFNEDEFKKRLDIVRLENAERQELTFPTRKKITDDSIMTIMNEENKFKIH